MIYKNIISLCNTKNISVAKLERETGLSNGTVGKWKKTSPTIDNVVKVADFFGVTVDDLISKASEAAG